MNARTLLATTATLALLSVVAHAQTPATPAKPTLERGIVRVEAHPNSERQRLHPSEFALFSGNAKIDTLGFDSVAAIAPAGLTPFVSLLPIRVRATLTLEPGQYRLGVWIPQAFRFADAPCKISIVTADDEPIYDGVAGDGNRTKNMSEPFALDEKADLEIVYDVVCPYASRSGSGTLNNMRAGEPRIMLMIARGNEEPREIAPREISAEAMPAITRTLGQRRPEAPTLASGMRAGWKVEHRNAAFAPLYGTGTLEEKWTAIWRTPVVATIAAPGPTMAPPAQAQGQRPRDTASSAITMTSNLIVTPENAGTTWLAIAASTSSIASPFNCVSEALVGDQRIENQSRHNPFTSSTLNVVFPADGHKHLAGAWLLPDLAPGAYPVKISIACATTALTIIGGDIAVLLKRPNDRALRLATPGEFVIEK